MKDAFILILIIVGAFALVGWLSRLFQRRFNLQRNILGPRVTKKSRAIAIMAAFLFGLIYFIEITYLEKFHSIFLLIAVIALAYSFRKPQDDTEEK
jgi:asparagine N-glycosylation enzyme membrane subunit Stt3